MVIFSISHLSTNFGSSLVFPTKNYPVMGNVSERNQPSSAKRVAVVGAGVSGLAAAYKLKSNGLNVTLYEADSRAGGKLKTVVKDGLIWDEGANTMTESEEEVTSLFDDLKLREKLQLPISQNKRYIVRDGLPVLLPSNPIALLQSNILSAQSKLQIMLEPFLWRKHNATQVSDNHAHESVGEFFERHFGKEFVDYVIDPFVAGTSGGDPQSLSMRHAFPELWNIENRFGSVIAGFFKSKLSSKKEKGGGSNKKPRVRGSFSFQGGMQTLVDTMCKQFGKDELKLQCKVLSLSHNPNESPSSENWSVSSMSNNNIQDQQYDAVIVTAPIRNVKELKIIQGGNPFSLDFIPEVICLPLSVIITTFKKANVKRPLKGFGVLVPSNEQHNGLKTLGTLFSSMMFPDRAPSDVYLYTTFVGGSRNRELAKASKDELKQIVSSDLQQLLGTDAEPSFVNHYYWSNAFPLYGRNYDSVLRAIEKMERDLPGVFYAGNHKDGLSVGKSIASGYKAAEHVISYLDSKLDAKMKTL
ncbi:protoporphyrinogen oxidase, chloroplastic/mitochondrial-like [Chenopodium quinoa]|uniref:protoporphyrinogen oxidase, chloroplastic/mitochondrial-like n=1 Tax=Chenopodium quinoa TaxID=63459 RepID=UPI000B78A48B|nr:protoporphyrinogen oxidase, chloroplastic/mitochondrial-like [Chenopodium quinoa]